MKIWCKFYKRPYQVCLFLFKSSVLLSATKTLIQNSGSSFESLGRKILVREVGFEPTFFTL